MARMRQRCKFRNVVCRLVRDLMLLQVSSVWEYLLANSLCILFRFSVTLFKKGTAHAEETFMRMLE